MMTNIGISKVPMALVGCATILAANLLPDQAYEVLHVRRQAIIPATVVAQSPPAPQATPSQSNSPTVRFVLLPESEKNSVSKLCSRDGPKVDGSWKATEQDVAKLESNLNRISSLRSTGTLKGTRIAHPENCYRQYIAVIVAKRKLIYVNAFCGIPAHQGWRTHFVTICDGGASVWGALYDPTTEEFSDLQVNGVA